MAENKEPRHTWDDIRQAFEAAADSARAFPSLKDGFEALLARARDEVASAGTVEDLREIRNRYLGRKRGQIKDALGYISKVPAEARGAFGKMVNVAKRELEGAIQNREGGLGSGATVAAAPSVDITLPGVRPARGSLHPITQTFRDIARSFERLGFSWVSGPEVETARYNFEGLNIPSGHPARDREENFMLTPEILLRTQTSTVQVRVMEDRQPPIRVVAPGRVYRPDTVDATHHFMFHQVEGLMVDEGVSFADLKTVLSHFSRDYFGPRTRMRLRPSFFPFTEPSAEMDISCLFCDGEGCSVCKQTGWIEVAGCGMVDPAVLEFVDIDPERYTGFAFGLGADRFAMIRHRINDIRLLTENDVRFLEQF